MTKNVKQNTLSADNLRHAEYYGMQEKFDSLYQKSKNGKKFTNLMDAILNRENILLAYRNLKSNEGSETPGTDGVTISDIGKMNPEEVVEKVRFILIGSEHGYRPKPVRRKDIPKPNGKTRPLGIPCMWDRLIQQSIKQILEPICEAKFSDNSYGFRPNRSVEHAISSCYRMMQRDKMTYVIEFDIEGFFDNVNHSKLVKQMWALGIQDKTLIYIIRKMLTAEIKMPDGKIIKPDKGIPQGGIISPLLANIVLNELDKWIESQWQEHPLVLKFSHDRTDEGKGFDRGSGYRSARNTNLKEMHIVRYADDFRIFCKTEDDAKRTMIATTQWIQERLKLSVSKAKTRLINLEKENMEFLGFKMKLRKKRKTLTVVSHMSDKAYEHALNALKAQAKNIGHHRKGKNEFQEVQLYNAMVLGIQNYYSIATDINLDTSKLQRALMTVLTNSLGSNRGVRMSKEGGELTDFEKKTFGKSEMLRYTKATKQPIYPIGYTQTRHPMAKKTTTCSYTPEGREGLHDNLRINQNVLIALMKSSDRHQSIEFNDNKLSKFSAQFGKCAIMGKEFQVVSDIHCHHKLPKHLGGSDKYENLILVLEPVHKLIHATAEETINKYLDMLNLNKEQLTKLNELRVMAKNQPIET